MTDNGLDLSQTDAEVEFTYHVYAPQKSRHRHEGCSKYSREFVFAETREHGHVGVCFSYYIYQAQY